MPALLIKFINLLDGDTNNKRKYGRNRLFYNPASALSGCFYLRAAALWVSIFILGFIGLNAATVDMINLGIPEMVPRYILFSL